MPKAWSKKDERRYEHVKESSKKRGASIRRAKEIASRTVNKQRREEGRTPQKSTSGTGNPNRPLSERSREELYNLAKDLKVRGRSTMNKSELEKAIRQRR